jgi:hypothetical protein
MSQVDERPLGTLIFTAENNIILYTAELFNLNSGLTVSKHNQLTFKKDKTPKIVKFIEGSNLIFLLNEQAPYKLYSVRIEPLADKNNELEMQALTKSFTYIYETSLSFDPKLNNPIDFDCYIQEKKNSDVKTFMFFIRDKVNIILFGFDEQLISCRPIKLNEDFAMQNSDEQSTQSSKLQNLKIDPEDREKFAKLEKNLENSSKILSSYSGKANVEKEETKKFVKDSEIGQISERETESGGNDKQPSKDEKLIKETKDLDERIDNFERSDCNDSFSKQSQSDKSSAHKDIKIVKYSLESNYASDEAGGNLKEYDDNNENNLNEDLKESNDESIGFINKVRHTTVSKNKITSDLSEKNKMRRSRHEREAKEIASSQDVDEKPLQIEESKGSQSTSYMHNQNQMFSMLSKGKMILENRSSPEKQANKQDDAQRSTGEEEIKEQLEESKTDIIINKEDIEREVSQEESKEDKYPEEQSNTQSLIISPSKKPVEQYRQSPQLERKKQSEGSKSVETVI